MKTINLYPSEREALYKDHEQGYFVNTCNNWLCPFNNDGICVIQRSTDCIDDPELDKDIDILYELSSSLDENEVNFAFEAWRDLIIERYGYKCLN